MDAISARNVRLLRDAGALAELPHPMTTSGLARAWFGDFAGAASLIAEAEDLSAATGSPFAPYLALRLRALQGRAAEASALIASAIAQADDGGPEMTAAQARWAAAVLYNGLGQYAEATRAARQATADPLRTVGVDVRPARARRGGHAEGDTELARNALQRLAATTQPCGTDVALGIEARSRGLLSDGADAEHRYREAIEPLSRTRLRPELARAHLLYGEWLRREGRRHETRGQLRTAYDMMVAIGMEAFAERARRELVAAGDTVRRRRVGTREQLTPQEEQIARLARDGLSNPEIGVLLVIRTHRRVASAQGVLQARHQLSPAAPARLVRPGRPVATG
jgi:hypothetical protein